MTDSTTLPISDAAALHSEPKPSTAKPRSSRPIPLPPPVPLGMLGGRDAAQPAEDQNEQDLEKALLRAPPWLVSTVIHMLALILMGISYSSVAQKQEVEVQAYGDGAGEGDSLMGDSLGLETEAPTTLSGTDFSPIEMPTSMGTLTSPGLSDLTSLSPHGSGLSGLAGGSPKGKGGGGGGDSIGLAFSGRGTGMRKVLGRMFGETAETREAVKRSLDWFKRNQRSDGAWSLKGPYADGAYDEDFPAATAMALLAFQGDGHTHKSGAHKAIVQKGWSALVKMQSPEGQFLGSGISSQHQLYAHAQCTIALCELYGMTHDSVYRTPAEKAIAFCVKSQDPELGGWRYVPAVDSDLSVTGWFLMALQSARMAELPVPQEVFDKASRFLDKVQMAEGSQYGYIVNSQSTLAMTAEGLLSRQYLGWKKDDVRLTGGVNYLSAFPIKMTASERDAYYWYYATQMLHHMEGDAWRRWNRVMAVEVPKAQNKDGREAGSWDPGPYRWGGEGGRLFITALQTFMLEVYYRHLPLYSNLGGRITKAQ